MSRKVKVLSTAQTIPIAPTGNMLPTPCSDGYEFDRLITYLQGVSAK